MQKSFRNIGHLLATHIEISLLTHNERRIIRDFCHAAIWQAPGLPGLDLFHNPIGKPVQAMITRPGLTYAKQAQIAAYTVLVWEGLQDGIEDF